MGFAADGRNLLYGLELAVPSAPTAFLRLPNVMVSINTKDRQVVAEQANLAADLKQTYLKTLAPDVSVDLDGLTEVELAIWRSLQTSPSEFYLLRVKRIERIFAQPSIVQELTPGVFTCVVPHSSYTLGSKRSVDGGGPSLLSNFKISAGWTNAYEDNPTAGPGNFFTSYADTTEIATLNAAFAPPSGSVCYVNYSASAWLAKMTPGMSWNPYSSASDRHAGSVTFEGA